MSYIERDASSCANRYEIVQHVMTFDRRDREKCKICEVLYNLENEKCSRNFCHMGLESILSIKRVFNNL